MVPVAPGRYEATLPPPAAGQGVYRLEVLRDESPAIEHFVTVPFPPEYRRFGTDRTALDDLVKLAGGGSRIINHPQRDIAEWLRAREKGRAYRSARPVLLLLAMVFLLLEVAARGMRRGRAPRPGGEAA